LRNFLKSVIFLFKKTGDIRKMISENEILEQLGRGKISLPPLTFRLLKNQPAIMGNRRLDAFIEAAWNDRSAKFAVEVKSISTPKAFQAGIDMLKAVPLPDGYNPLLIMPYLGERQMSELEKAGVNGMDLSGNAVIVVPGEFAIYRTGGKNLYPSSAPIKNIYRMNSSMVGRVFLSRPRYDTVREIQDEVNRRNILAARYGKTPMSLSTVSKALGTLVDDLIVGRTPVISLIQADTLLEKLTANYTSPKIKETVRMKVPESGDSLHDMLVRQARKAKVPVVATGLSSVTHYATMQRGEMLSVYCPRPEDVLEGVSGSMTDRFPNVEILETDDETVYFDASCEDGFMWASPVQTYLELMAGDKRDRETAVQVRSYILSRLERKEAL